MAASTEDSAPAPAPATAPDTAPLLDKAVAVPAERADDYSALPPSEAKILRAQVAQTETSASFLSLFRYATAFDKVLLLIGMAAALGEGAMRPLMTIVFGQITDLFTRYTRGEMMYPEYYNGTAAWNGTYAPGAAHAWPEASALNETYANATHYADSYFSLEPVSPDMFQREVARLALYFVYIGIADVALSYLATYLFIDRGEVLSARIREKYLESTMRQNIGYFDKLGTGEITSRISADAILIQEGISEKIGYVVANFSTLIVGFVVSLTRSYKLALILFSALVLIMVSFAVGAQKTKQAVRKSLNGYSVGGSLAEEVLASIRNVQAFGIQEYLAKQYDFHLEITEYWGLRAGVSLGIMIGIMWFGVFAADALAFWQGSRFIESGEVTTGRITTVLFTITHGAFAASHIAPHFKAFTAATAAASKIYATIDRESAIDSKSDAGRTIADLKGEIELDGVKFVYPSRPSVTVLEDYSLTIPAGKTVALVGASGSGKSTIVGIIERFYLPVKGTVKLDGVDITELNLRWLRSQISLVSQEPTLFSCSVFDNVAHGLVGSALADVSPAEKEQLVREACRQANALDFIEALPEGFATGVGERGFLLSGGQKQRIAIARAIVSNPRILLLDEATSALDTKSEGVVQDALDRAAKNRTTIVIAHRLSTIKDADRIIVMKKGQILETGTHAQLIEAQGEYYELVQSQKIAALKKTEPTFDEKADAAVAVVEAALAESRKSVDEPALEKIATVAGAAAEPEKQYSVVELIAFIGGLTAPENTFMFLGIFCSFIQGMSYIALGEFYGRCIQALQFAFTDRDYMHQEIYRYSGLFLMLAVVLFVAVSSGQSLYAYVAQRLIRRIRFQMFRNMMRQDIEFFDRDENTTGALTMALARDAQSIDGLSGATFGQIMNSLVNVTSSIILAVVIAYKLGLVCAACVPILVSSGFFRFYVLSKFEETVKKSHEASASYACEAAGSIRTVASLTREDDVLATYRATLAEQTQKSRGPSSLSAFLYGLAQGMQYFITALAFWWGGTLIRDRQYGLLEFYVAYMSVIFGAQGAGIVFSYSSDMGKARNAAASIKRLFDRQPQIDAWSTAGDVPTAVEGNIEFRDVYFRYPTRPQVSVLNGLNLKIRQGQYVALVGSSGCGKSTTIGLTEMFYRPYRGQILLDGHDINSFNISAYRENIALVSQEPTLYAGTIMENVRLGALHDLSDDEVFAACKQANIHSFIMSLPDGYDTLCGSKGSLLSGGQKQRIAIARALVRNPKILLLDEATSALDSESEKIVQAALDAAAKGRTTIAVAHRLSTIQDADVIFVFDAGKIVESGTHQELLALGGKYFELVQMQALEEMQ
ncbi:P-loop containing nucleoside triphosphate hydrolase protein [Dipodascopsis tothii]|uniref:P-loop containing nucleoside triphosphate hydrolase protein n=1 Tax=Dipodascopsis tothii TaxID=44089 RepID=UPI0034CFBB01